MKMVAVNPIFLPGGMMKRGRCMNSTDCHWVASDSLMKPLVGDCGAVWMSGRHKRELEERRGSSVKHLDVHGVDLPKLLDQCCMVV